VANKTEDQMRKVLEDRGLTVLHKGWPDFLVVDEKNNRGFACEVKSYSDKLRPEQEVMHEALSRFGIMVMIVRPANIAELGKKKGRVLYTPDDLRWVRSKVRDLEEELAVLQDTLVHVSNCLDVSTVLLDPSARPSNNEWILTKDGRAVVRPVYKPTESVAKPPERVRYEDGRSE
jgi:hypothetical protein